MNAKWEGFYEQLLSDLKRCEKMELPEVEIAECCYRVSVSYWYKIREFFVQRIMYVDEEEIEFFKHVKPKFTAHIEYNLVLNQALLFIPVDKEADLIYWKEEANRYKRFFDRNAAFIRYYESGCTKEDASYFLQRNNNIGLLPQERIYEDLDCRSSHDHLVRGLLANTMYRQYVENRIKELDQ